MRIVCPFCRNFSAISYGNVLKHIEDVHQFEPGFQLKCHFCPQTYTNVSSYRSVLTTTLDLSLMIGYNMLSLIEHPDPIFTGSITNSKSNWRLNQRAMMGCVQQMMIQKLYGTLIPILKIVILKKMTGGSIKQHSLF